MSMTEPPQGLPLTEARMLLRVWAGHAAERDRLVRAAYTAGLSKREIHRLTGLARMTVDHILNDGRHAKETP